jgi:hypothetical protein
MAFPTVATSEDCNNNGVVDECEFDGILVYELSLANLVNTPNDCGFGSRYGMNPGLSWNDEGGGTVNRVTVQVNFGVDCHETGALHVITLNGVTQTATHSSTSHCFCTDVPGNMVTFELDPADYVIGGANTLAFSTTTWLGFIPRTEWQEAYALITVEYVGESDCNANDIPDTCEIAANPAIDANNNGIIDSCESQN